MTLIDWMPIIIMVVWMLVAFILLGIAEANCKDNQTPNFLFVFLWHFVLVALPLVMIGLWVEKIVKRLKRK